MYASRFAEFGEVRHQLDEDVADHRHGQPPRQFII